MTKLLWRSQICSTKSKEYRLKCMVINCPVKKMRSLVGSEKPHEGYSLFFHHLLSFATNNVFMPVIHAYRERSVVIL